MKPSVAGKGRSGAGAAGPARGQRPVNASPAAMPSAASIGWRAPILPRAVGTFVPGLTRKAFEKYGFSAATLLTDWATIVGAELSSYTLPERLKWPRAVEAYGETESGGEGRPGATLVLRVDGPRAIEVEYRARQIIDRINSFFGYRAVAEMRIIQGPVTAPAKSTPAVQRPAAGAPRAPAPEIERIDDPGLKEALARLEAGVLARRAQASGKPTRR